MPYREVKDPARLQALLGAVMLIETDVERDVLLHRIVQVAVEQIGAQYGALGVLAPDGERLERFLHVGIDQDLADRIGHLPEGRGVLGVLISHPESLDLEHLSEHPASVGFPAEHPPMDSFLGTPIRVRGVVYGDLYLCDKTNGEVFNVDDVAVLETLAIAAGIAISNARLRERVSELSVAEERDRIARDLHDTVIQRLYGIGLTLQGAIPSVEAERTRARLQISLDEIDATIRQIRTSIFELEPATVGPKGLRAQVVGLTTESAQMLGFEPEVHFIGPLDTMIGDSLIPHVLAVLRESLSNVARHAHAHRVRVEVSLHAGQVAVVVIDDGVGLPRKNLAPGNGLRNLNERAALLLGSCLIEAGEGSGTKMVWRVPV